MKTVVIKIQVPDNTPVENLNEHYEGFYHDVDVLYSMLKYRSTPLYSIKFEDETLFKNEI